MSGQAPTSAAWPHTCDVSTYPPLLVDTLSAVGGSGVSDEFLCIVSPHSYEKLCLRLDARKDAACQGERTPGWVRSRAHGR